MGRWLVLGALLLALAASVWLVGRGSGARGDATEHGATSAAAGALEPRGEDELRLAMPLDGVADEPTTADAAEAGEARRDEVRGDVPRAARSRAPIRGQLFIRGTEEALDEALTIRLRSGDLRVKETVTSTPDGAFTSTVAFPRGFVLAEVLYPAGDAVVDHEGRFDPRSEDVWPVHVPWPTFVRGRFVDRSGAPLADVDVLVASSAPVQDDRDGRSGADGTWSARVERGTRTLHALRGIERATLRVEVVRGPNELGDVVLPFGSGGEIRGVLRAPGADPQAALELVSLDTGALLATYTGEDEDENDGTSAFAFDEVPPGEYRLTVLAADGRRYEPAQRTVSPPALDVEFRSEDEPAWRELEQRITAEDGAPADGKILALVNGRWREFEGAQWSAESWIVLDGKRIAPAALDDEGVLVARYEPGWGGAFLCAEAGDGGAPLADVQVFADGRLVATSDRAGLALARLGAGPGTIEFRLAGWSVHSVWGGVPTQVMLVRE
jgi:hypothetical protein